MPATEIQANVKIGVKNIDEYLKVIEEAERLTKELKDCLWRLSGLQLGVEVTNEKAASGN